MRMFVNRLILTDMSYYLCSRACPVTMICQQDIRIFYLLVRGFIFVYY
jgi:hypothetical protein